MTPRTIAIGDIHGCLAALETLLEAIAPARQDVLVTLGDYVDRGPDSRGVLARLLALARQTRLVPLLGNHDEMMLSVCAGRQDLLAGWLVFGGRQTLASYDADSPEQLARGHRRHLDFLRSCRLFHETERHFLVHANYKADLPLDQQPRQLLLWLSLKDNQPGPHCSGKLAVVGHTAQKNGEILDLGYLTCIDTCCYGDGWLTAMELETGRLWQADKEGKIRDLGI
jgi:serine/threonine protein phosphatase 1